MIRALQPRAQAFEDLGVRHLDTRAGTAGRHGHVPCACGIERDYVGGLV